ARRFDQKLLEGPRTLQPRHYFDFHKVVAHACARAVFDAVADFFAEGLESVGGTKAMAAALGVFAACDVPAVAARFDGSLEFHTTKTLRLDVHAVNDPNNDRAHRGLRITHDLPRRISFVNHQHPIPHARSHTAVNRHKVAARFAGEVFFLHDQQFLAGVERVVDRRNDVPFDGADDHT